MVLEGMAKILHKNRMQPDTNIVIKDLAPGDVVGEFSMFSAGNQTRTASVLVPSGGKPLIMLEFGKRDLKWLGPPFSDQVLRSMRQFGRTRAEMSFSIV